MPPLFRETSNFKDATNMRQNKIKNPFLNYLLMFYGNIGKQLYDIEYSYWPSLLNFSWNLVLNIICISGMFFFDPYRSESGYIEYHRFTPLLRMIVKLDLQFVYPAGYLFETVYLQLFGRELVHLLDSEPLQKVYHSRRLFCYIAVVILLFINVFSFLSDYDTFKLMLSEPDIPLGHVIINILCLTEYIHYVTFVFIMLIYFKWAIYQRLKELQRKVTFDDFDAGK